MASNNEKKNDGSLPGFQAITKSVSIHRPSAKASSGNHISLVVLCTWMGANRKHIAKYTDYYLHKYPDTEILVVESALGDMISNEREIRSPSFAAAQDVLLSHLECGNDRSVLLHAFSNGGSYFATLLTSIIPIDRRDTAFRAIILDSCPGQGTFRQSAKAITMQLPQSAAIRLIVIALTYLLLFGMFVWDCICWTQNIVTQIREDLNNTEVIPVSTPRLYLYSKADPLVSWQHVQAHAKEARQKGYTDVQEHIYEDSPHCAHAVKYKENYWKQVGMMVDIDRT